MAFFVTTMKFSDVVVGATDMGELIVSSMILVISFLLVVMVRKDRMALQVMLGGTAIVYLAAYIASLFVPVNFAWVSMGLLVLAVIYLIYLSVKNWIWAVIPIFQSCLMQ